MKTIAAALFRKSQQSRRGVIGGVTELIITLAVGGIVLGGLATLSVQQAASVKNQVTSLQFKQVHAAASQYVKDEYNALLTNTVGGVYPVFETLTCGGGNQSWNQVDHFDNLKTRGYLPSYFSRTNPYGQTYRLYVGIVCPNGTDRQVAAWVVTDSNDATPGQPTARNHAISKTDIAKVAAMSGNLGGYVAYNTDPAAGGLDNQIIGAFGGWKTDITTQALQGIDYNLTPGYLVAPVIAGGNTTVNDYLYRHPVPGNPDANSMFTDINMQGGGDTQPRNDIKNAEQIEGEVLVGNTATVAGRIYSGWKWDDSTASFLNTGLSGTIDARGTIKSEGGNIEAYYDASRATGGNVSATGGNISSTKSGGLGGDITATGGQIVSRKDDTQVISGGIPGSFYGIGGDIMTFKYGGTGGNISATGGDITASKYGGTGGNISALAGMITGDYLRTMPKNILDGGDCVDPGKLGAMSDGRLLVCVGTTTTPKWTKPDSDMKIKHVRDQQIVSTDIISCADGYSPSAALLGLNELAPIRTCSLWGQFWGGFGCPGTAVGYITDWWSPHYGEIAQSTCTYNGNVWSYGYWNNVDNANCSGGPDWGFGRYTQTPIAPGCSPYWWYQGGCISAQVGKRGFIQELNDAWKFYIAKYEVHGGAFFWLDDPLNVGGAQAGSPGVYPNSVYMSFNPWCEDNDRNPTELDKERCRESTPTNPSFGDSAGVLYFCLPNNT